MPKIYLYAEILTHIKQLTLHASAQTEKREGTKLEVTTDKTVISVTHDGETQRLYLPTQVKGDCTVTFPLLKTTDISARVQIEDEHEWKCMISDEIEAPWMAADLSSSTAIRCRNCDAPILESEKVHQWKALPSENWAELMDVWFCHKPHDEESDAHEAAAAKGFSSNNKLAIVRGTGMTDLVAIVLHADDCANIKAAEKQSKPDLTVLRCSKCLEMIGTTNEDENLVRLHKSSISVSKPGASSTWIKYPSCVFTCAQILSLIEATNLKRFVVYSKPSENELTGEKHQPVPLLLWVFNPDIYFSCSAYEGNSTLSNAAAPETAVDGDVSTGASKDKQSEPQEHMESPARKLTTQENDRNPNNDDASQIYGESSAPQLISGDLEFEIPVPNREQNPNSSDPAFSEIPIESMVETETPLISAKQTSSSTGEGAATVETHTPITDTEAQNAANNGASEAGAATPSKEHINLVHRAAKIFYKPFSAGIDPIQFLDEPANSSSHEELYLADPADLIALRETLEKSTSMLPSTARSFQDWHVGLLDRYEKVPSGLGVMAENPLARGIQAKDGRVTRWSLGNGAEGLYA